MKSKIIVFSGLPGSGKSSIAEVLAEKLSWPLFSVDPIESAILRSGLSRNFESGLAAYLVAEALAAEQLKLGLSLVIDAVNSVSEARVLWRQLADKYQAKLFIIECTLSPKTHKKRIESRVREMHGISETTWENVEQRKKEFKPWSVDRLLLDSELPIAENIDKILQFISN